MLLHLVDGTGEDVGADYESVRRELEAYGHGLSGKPEIVAVSKADALAPEQLKQQRARLESAAGKAPLVVSAVTGTGVAEALRALLAAIDQARTADSRQHTLAQWRL